MHNPGPEPHITTWLVLKHSQVTMKSLLNTSRMRLKTATMTLITSGQIRTSNRSRSSQPSWELLARY